MRLRGYGRNKIVHLLALWRSGFKLMVQPEGFCVHRWHPRTEVHQQYAHATRNEGVRLKSHNLVLYQQVGMGEREGAHQGAPAGGPVVGGARGGGRGRSELVTKTTEKWLGVDHRPKTRPKLPWASSGIISHLCTYALTFLVLQAYPPRGASM